MTSLTINDYLCSFVLQYIFSMLPEGHAAIAKVCRAWNQAQKENIIKYSGMYFQILKMHRLPTIKGAPQPTEVEPQTTAQRLQYVKNTILLSRKFYAQYPEVDQHGNLIKFPCGPIHPQSLELIIQQTEQRKMDQDRIISFEKIRESGLTKN